MVHVSSSDTTVLKVLDSVVTIAPGIYYNNAGRVIPGGAGGTAYLKVSAGGATSDSALFTVAGPKIAFSWTTSLVGLGEEDDNVERAGAEQRAVAARHHAQRRHEHRRAAADGHDSHRELLRIVQRAGQGARIRPDLRHGDRIPVRHGDVHHVTHSPRLAVFGGSTLNNFGPPVAFKVESADSLRSAHVQTAPLAVHFTSTDPTIITVDTGATIVAGLYYSNTSQVTPVGVGTAKVVATAAAIPARHDHVRRADAGAFHEIRDDVHDRCAREAAPDGLRRPGAQQSHDAARHHADARSTRRSTRSSTTTPTIGTGTFFTNFTIAGLTPGVDTVTASAPGYLPYTASVVRVTTPKLGVSFLSTPLTTTSPPLRM